MVRHCLVYQAPSDVALSEYIKLVFRTSHFRQVINGMISGASGHKRVQPERIEPVDVPVPLPRLETQSAILEHIQAGRAEIARQRGEVEALILGTVRLQRIEELWE